MNPPKYLRDIKLEVPWGHIAAKTWGMESGKRALLVHGTLDNAGAFDRLLLLLPNNFYYVVVDLPGHGYSSPFPSGTLLGFFDYVLAIRLILDKLQWQNCIYVGHSFGAQLGLLTSILYPGRITKIACLDGLIPVPIRPKDIAKRIKMLHEIVIRSISNDKAPLYTEDEMLYALKFRRNFALTSEAAQALLERGRIKVGNLFKFSRDYRLREFVNPLLDLKHYQELFKNLKIPVLLIYAEWSWLDKSYTNEDIIDAKTMLGANFTLVEVSGNHDVHNNNPEIIAPHLRKFMDDTPKSRL
ncbi:serine hydrolase-like protein [Venturia canescens]|uniref:serine hydrolase-like protein n=1 Tax=Venturia canescens TaxID=32260 RepID=UPI001C9BE293|nr:serine hydrolase-like protein [Venturia canescens]XP_043277705.1 serine hydrolase-like protein [Venturia canescens]XP_043277706.1 serine hydrolase-like protein [Venturia canescens]